MVVRIDGKGFHDFSAQHGFAKPNDAPALELMNEAARHVMQELKGQVILAFGESDEYSFLFAKQCTLYNRRESKIVTHVVSLFTGAYIFNWSKFMPDTPLQRPPSFDGRLVVYPSAKEVRDYFAWRQVDTHINNLYNTTFWALIQQGGMSEHQANEELRHTISSQKHEILFGKFGINYDRLPPMFRKGTTLVWSAIPGATTEPSADPQPSSPSPHQASTGRQGKREEPKSKPRKVLRTLHVDIIGDGFWSAAPDVSASSLPSDDAAAGGQPWDHPSRVHGDGLGSLLLQ
ncbi:tRNA-His guanylyltransferase [Tilletia horrida]|nr:tRNA-His guanylyltransferase [Tilletia horrida]